MGSAQPCAGDIQAEIQYATPETPLGRESYGLMMLVNVLVWPQACLSYSLPDSAVG